MAENKSNLLVRTFREFSEDDCLSMAAALAYYTVFSLPPLLVLIITIVGLAYDPQTAQQAIEEQIGGTAGEGVKEQIHMMIQAANRPERGAIATVVGYVHRNDPNELRAERITIDGRTVELR